MRGLSALSPWADSAQPLRRLRAARISSALRELLAAGPPPGQVESVHSAAINLRFGSSLATIARESVGGLPMGIQLVGEPSLDQVGVSRGMQVVLHGSNLTIHDAGTVVALGAAASWSPAMPIPPVLSADRRWRRIEATLRLAVPLAPAIGLAPLLPVLAGEPRAVRGTLAERVRMALVDVLELLAAGEMALAVERARPLIGLGPGATPSGDDLLVGLLAGLTAIRHPLAATLASGVAAQAAGRTTALSEQFLADAGRLRFSERAQRTTAAVLVGGPAELRSAVLSTLAWGASSGADLLAGILIGIGADLPMLARSLRGLPGQAEAAA